MNDQEARHRHLQLFGIRILAILTAGVGVVIISGRWISEPMIGYALFLIGVVEFFVLPQWLVKQWKNQDK
ncbi:hypothetical protein ACFCW2_02300 [Qipengyuania sp. DSG2-2]|uniref:hypothetical protein n=1 Tax=Qipengyuania sp. DGS2-2 TaxID=3349631 RepID=UPI0036D28FD6